jgi:antitoxin MazE
MQTRIQKWGNSLGVRIPRSLAVALGVGPGSEVSLSVLDGELIVKPAFPARFRLEDLLAAITPENLHSAVDTGKAVGVETF